MPAARNKKRTFYTAAETATEALGASIGRRIEEGMCVALVGSLGTGKSVLVRGLCKGLGVEESVLSPTFVLFEEYSGRRPVIHLDLYRLEHEKDIEELGVFDRLGDESVILVEWGDRSGTILDIADILIRLEMTESTERRITMEYPERLDGIISGIEPL